MEKIYLDYSASTPLDNEVLKIVHKNLKDVYGNPGSLHAFGQKAINILDISREVTASILNADFREVVFTASATEANNLALRGAVRAFSLHTKKKLKPKILVSAIEHESVLQTAFDLEREGLVCVEIIPVDKNGFVLPESIEKSLDERTVLISVMYANNVVGSIQPISEIAKVISNWKLAIGDIKSVYPLLHADAVQAFQYLNCDVKKLGVDLFTLSSHKIYGPKGVGVLYIRNSKSQILNNKQVSNYNNQNKKQDGILNFPLVEPIITGGGQEFNFRSGTQAAPLIAGFAHALKKSDSARVHETKRIKELKKYLLDMLAKHLPKIQVNGGKGNNFLPNIINLYIPGDYTSGELLIALDMRGIAVSSGSACSVRSEKPSYVLQALQVKENRAKSSIRISMGKFTTKSELSRFVSVLKDILKKKFL